MTTAASAQPGLIPIPMVHPVRGVSVLVSEDEVPLYRTEGFRVASESAIENPGAACGNSYAVAREQVTVLQPDPEFPLISFGRESWFLESEWEHIAPKARDTLGREAMLLRADVTGVKELVAEFNELSSGPVGAVVGWTSAAAAHLKDVLGGVDVPDCPKPSEFDALVAEVDDAELHLYADPYTPGDLFDAGWAFEAVRRDADALRRRFSAHRNALISGAESTQKALEIVEDSAFQVLDKAIEVYTITQPVMNEVGLKLAALLGRSAAAGAGEALAGGAGVLAALKRLAVLAPGKLSAMLIKALKLQRLGRAKSAVEGLLGFAFDVLIRLVEDNVRESWAEHEGKPLTASKKEEARKAFKKHVVASAQSRLLAAFVDTLGAGGNGKTPGDRVKAALAESSTLVLAELQSAIDTAENKGISLTDALLADGLSIVVRILFGVGLKFLEPSAAESRKRHLKRFGGSMELRPASFPKGAKPKRGGRLSPKQKRRRANEAAGKARRKQRKRKKK